MKKFLLTAAIVAGAATVAQAADLPRKAPIKAPILQVYDWTGFYIGVNAGGSVGRDLTRATSAFANEASHLSPAGAVGGGQIGYNVQFRNFYNLVLGVEADIQASGQRDNFTCLLACTPPAAFQTYSQKIDWFGTARARVGLASGPVLSYVTGGYAYGHVSTSSTAALGGVTAVGTQSQTRGGYVIGSGVEAQLGGNWTGKIEYLYVDLGTQRTAGVIAGVPFTGSSKIQDHVFRAGVNYQFGGNANYIAPVANWSGFYLGGNVGSIIGRNRTTITPIQFSLVPEGYIGGGQIGYNWQAGAWVFGVEGDFQGSTAKDNKACVFLCTPVLAVAINQKLPWLATARGRIGYSVGSTLFYGTAGYAYGETKTAFTVVGAAPVPEVKKSKGGYVVGAGIESPLSFLGLFGPNWTTKTEYLYVDLGRISAPAIGFTTQTREHIFRTGINYHFNTPIAAVVAKN